MTFDRVHPKHVVAWSNGLDILSVVTTTVRSDDVTSEPAAKAGAPGVNAIMVHLWIADQ
jgi:hypothetical protein